MTEIGEAYVRLRPNLDTFRAETETGVRSALGGVARTAAAALGGVSVIAAIKQTVQAAAAQEQALVAVRRAVTATNASWKVYGSTVDQVLKRQSVATGFTVEELAQTFTRVETATKNTAQSMKILAAAEDVARARGTDVASSALVITRATLGSTASLRRLGIVIPQVTTAQDHLTAAHTKLVAAGAKFTSAQEAQYKAALKVAKAHDEQASKTNVLAEVTRRFGGQAAAFANTSAGQFARFQRSITELEVSIGDQLLPTLNTAVETLRRWVGELTTSEGVHTTVHNAVRGIADAFSLMGRTLRTLQPVLTPVIHLLDQVGGGGILAFIAGWKAVGPAISLASAAQQKWNAILAAARGEQVTTTQGTARMVAEADGATAALTREAAALRALGTEATATNAQLSALASTQARVSATPSVAGFTGRGTALNASGTDLSSLASNVATVQQSFEGAEQAGKGFAASNTTLGATARIAAADQAQVATGATAISTAAGRATEAVSAEAAALRAVAVASTDAGRAETGFAAAQERLATVQALSAQRLAAINTVVAAQPFAQAAGDAASAAGSFGAFASAATDVSQSSLEAVKGVADTVTSFGDVGVAADSAGHLVDRASAAIEKSEHASRSLGSAHQVAADAERGLAAAHEEGAAQATTHAAAIDADTAALRKNAAAAGIATRAEQQRVAGGDSVVRSVTTLGAAQETAAARAVTWERDLTTSGLVASVFAHNVTEGAKPLENAARDTEKLGNEAKTASTRIQAFGRGLLQAIGGWPIAITAAAAALSFLLYKAFTAESDLEKQTKRTSEAFTAFGVALQSRKDLVQENVSAQSQLQTDRLATQTTQLSVAQARANLQTDSARSSVLNYSAAVNELSQAQDAYRVALAQVNADERSLAENRAKRAEANRVIQAQQGADLAALRDLIRQSGQDETNVLGRALRFRPFGGPQLGSLIPLAPPVAFKPPSASAELQLQQTVKALDDIGKKLRAAGAIDLGHAFRQFSALVSLLDRLPTTRELRIIADTGSADHQLRVLITEFNDATGGAVVFNENLERLRLSMRSLDPGLAARLKTLEAFTRLLGHQPTRAVTNQIVFATNFGAVLRTIRTELESMPGLAHKFGATSGQALYDAFVLTLKQLGLGASIGQALTTQAKGGLTPGQLTLDQNAVKNAQAAVRAASQAVTDAHQKVLDEQQTLDSAIRSLKDANQAIADAIRSGNQQIADAVRSAQSNLTSIGDSLASAIGDFLGQTKKAQKEFKPDSVELAEMRRIAALIRSGETGPELVQLRNRLQSQIEAQNTDTKKTVDPTVRIKRRIDDLTAQFETTNEPVKKFVAGIRRVLAANNITFESVKRKEGLAAAVTFQGDIRGIIQQAIAIRETHGRNAQGGQAFVPQIVRPAETIASVERDIANRQQQRDDQRLAVQRDTRALSAGQKALQAAIAAKAAKLDKLDQFQDQLAVDRQIEAHAKNTADHTATSNALLRQILHRLTPGTAATGGLFPGAIPGAGGRLTPGNVEKSAKPISFQGQIVLIPAAVKGQKKAGGGPVYGPDGIDKVPAMLTAGEMILNRHQQRRLRGMLGIGDGTPESLFGMIDRGPQRHAQGGVPKRYAHGGVTTGGTRQPWAWWQADPYRDWMWGQGRPGERKREQARTGRKHGQEWAWGLGAGEDPYRPYPWWMPHETEQKPRQRFRHGGVPWTWMRRYAQGGVGEAEDWAWRSQGLMHYAHGGVAADKYRLPGFASGGTTAPFRDLPAEEKRRRILSGLSAGRMTFSQAKSAFQFWHLGLPPHADLGPKLERGPTKKLAPIPITEDDRIRFYGKQTHASPRQVKSALDYYHHHSIALAGRKFFGAANVAAIFFGPRGEINPEDFTGGGGTFKPEAMKGMFGRFVGGTKARQMKSATQLSRLSLGDEFTFPKLSSASPHEPPLGFRLVRWTDEGDAIVRATNEHTRLQYGTSDINLHVTDSVVQVTRQVRTPTPKNVGEFFAKVGHPEVTPEIARASQSGGRQLPRNVGPASVRKAIAEIGSPFKRGRVPRRVRAIADAMRLRGLEGPQSAALAGVLKHFPELQKYITADMMFRDIGLGAKGSVGFFVDEIVRLARAARPAPETGASVAAHRQAIEAETALRTQFPKLMTTAEIQTGAREGGAPSMTDAVGKYVRGKFPSAFRRDQPDRDYLRAKQTADLIPRVHQLTNELRSSEFVKGAYRNPLTHALLHVRRMAEEGNISGARGQVSSLILNEKSYFNTPEHEIAAPNRAPIEVMAELFGVLHRTRSYAQHHASQAFLQDAMHHKFAGGGVAIPSKSAARQLALLRSYENLPTKGGSGLPGFLDQIAGYAIGFKPSEILALRRRARHDPSAMVALGTMAGGTGGFRGSEGARLAGNVAGSVSYRAREFHRVFGLAPDAANRLARAEARRLRRAGPSLPSRLAEDTTLVDAGDHNRPLPLPFPATTRGQRSALTTYKAGFTDFALINDYLRSGKFGHFSSWLGNTDPMDAGMLPSDLRATQRRLVRSTLPQMLKAVQANRLPGPLTVFRGIPKHTLPKMFGTGQIRPGAEGVEKSFLSTTTSKPFAQVMSAFLSRAAVPESEELSQNEINRRFGALLHLRAPAGAHAVPLDAITGVTEGYVLFGPGQRMRITDVGRTPQGMTEIRADILRQRHRHKYAGGGIPTKQASRSLRLLKAYEGMGPGPTRFGPRFKTSWLDKLAGLAIGIKPSQIMALSRRAKHGDPAAMTALGTTLGGTGGQRALEAGPFRTILSGHLNVGEHVGTGITGSHFARMGLLKGVYKEYDRDEVDSVFGELLAPAVYRRLGVPTARNAFVPPTGIFSQLIHGIRPQPELAQYTRADLSRLERGFAGDVMLGHWDIKPQNLVMAKHGRTREPFRIDFSHLEGPTHKLNDQRFLTRVASLSRLQRPGIQELRRQSRVMQQRLPDAELAYLVKTIGKAVGVHPQVQEQYLETLIHNRDVIHGFTGRLMSNRDLMLKRHFYSAQNWRPRHFQQGGVAVPSKAAARQLALLRAYEKTGGAGPTRFGPKFPWKLLDTAVGYGLLGGIKPSQIPGLRRRAKHGDPGAIVSLGTLAGGTGGHGGAELFSNKGGVYHPNAVRGVLGRFLGSTRETMRQQETELAHLKVGQSFTTDNGAPWTYMGRTPEGKYRIKGQTVGHEHIVRNMAVKVGVVARTPTEANVRRIRGFGSPGVMGGISDPESLGPGGIQGLLASLGPQAHVPVRRVPRLTRREKAVAAAEKLTKPRGADRPGMSPFAASLAAVKKFYPRDRKVGLFQALVGDYGAVTAHGKSMSDVIREFPGDVDSPENVPYMVDALLRFFRGQKPPETAATHAAKQSGPEVKRRFPGLVTATEAARGSGAARVHEILGAKEPDLFFGDQPAWMHQSLPVAENTATAMGILTKLHSSPYARGATQQDLTHALSGISYSLRSGETASARKQTKRLFEDHQVMFREATNAPHGESPAQLIAQLMDVLKAKERTAPEEARRRKFLRNTIHNRFAGGGVAIPDKTAARQLALLRAYEKKGGARPTRFGPRFKPSWIDSAIGMVLGIKPSQALHPIRAAKAIPAAINAQLAEAQAHPTPSNVIAAGLAIEGGGLRLSEGRRSERFLRGVKGRPISRDEASDLRGQLVEGNLPGFPHPFLLPIGHAQRNARSQTRYLLANAALADIATGGTRHGLAGHGIFEPQARGGNLTAVASYRHIGGEIQPMHPRMYVSYAAASHGGLDLFRDLIAMAASRRGGLAFSAGDAAKPLYERLGMTTGGEGAHLPPRMVRVLHRDVLAFARAKRGGIELPEDPRFIEPGDAALLHELEVRQRRELAIARKKHGFQHGGTAIPDKSAARQLALLRAYEGRSAEGKRIGPRFKASWIDNALGLVLGIKPSQLAHPIRTAKGIPAAINAQLAEAQAHPNLSNVIAAGAMFEGRLSNRRLARRVGKSYEGLHGAFIDNPDEADYLRQELLEGRTAFRPGTPHAGMAASILHDIVRFPGHHDYMVHYNQRGLFSGAAGFDLPSDYSVGHVDVGSAAGAGAGAGLDVFKDIVKIAAAHRAGIEFSTTSHARPLYQLLGAPEGFHYANVSPRQARILNHDLFALARAKRGGLNIQDPKVLHALEVRLRRDAGLKRRGVPLPGQQMKLFAGGGVVGGAKKALGFLGGHARDFGHDELAAARLTYTSLRNLGMLLGGGDEQVVIRDSHGKAMTYHGKAMKVTAATLPFFGPLKGVLRGLTGSAIHGGEIGKNIAEARAAAKGSRRHLPNESQRLADRVARASHEFDAFDAPFLAAGTAVGSPFIGLFGTLAALVKGTRAAGRGAARAVTAREVKVAYRRGDINTAEMERLLGLALANKRADVTAGLSTSIAKHTSVGRGTDRSLRLWREEFAKGRINLPTYERIVEEVLAGKRPAFHPSHTLLEDVKPGRTMARRERKALSAALAGRRTVTPDMVTEALKAMLLRNELPLADYERLVGEVLRGAVTPRRGSPIAAAVREARATAHQHGEQESAGVGTWMRRLFGRERFALGGIAELAEASGGALSPSQLHRLIAPRPFQAGGLVPGAGNIDSVPALLTPGEYVMSRPQLERVGAAAMQTAPQLRPGRTSADFAQIRVLQAQHEEHIRMQRQQILLLGRIANQQITVRQAETHLQATERRTYVPHRPRAVKHAEQQALTGSML